jgi:hypothetical protein
MELPHVEGSDFGASKKKEFGQTTAFEAFGLV